LTKTSTRIIYGVNFFKKLHRTIRPKSPKTNYVR